MAISRIPDGPRATQTAPSTPQTVVRSSAGSAWHSEPPTVPRLRTTGSAMTRSASRKIGHTAASASDSSASRCRVIAPIRTTVGSTTTYPSSAAKSLMSTRYSGLAMRNFIIGSRLCPPATTIAPSPSRSSNPIAWSTLVARSYSNGPGTCISTTSLGRRPSLERRYRSVNTELSDRLTASM